jgi:hypothetical protein
MTHRQYSAIGVTVFGLIFWLVVWTAAQPQPGSQGHSSGGGLVSPSVVVTYSARFTPAIGKPASVRDKVAQTLDLLVLWRGSPGWFDHQDLSVGAGDTVHHVSTKGRSLELRIDSASATISLGSHMLVLDGANVVFLDHADRRLTIAGTSRVEPLLPPALNGPMDIVRTIARRLTEVFEYLRCDPTSVRVDDVSTQIGLRVCEGFR